MNVVAIPIVESNTELQGTRHSSMTARDVGGTTDRVCSRASKNRSTTGSISAVSLSITVFCRVHNDGYNDPTMGGKKPHTLSTRSYLGRLLLSHAVPVDGPRCPPSPARRGRRRTVSPPRPPLRAGGTVCRACARAFGCVLGCVCNGCNSCTARTQSDGGRMN